MQLRDLSSPGNFINFLFHSLPSRSLSPHASPFLAVVESRRAARIRRSSSRADDEDEDEQRGAGTQTVREVHSESAGRPTKEWRVMIPIHVQ